MKHPPVVYIEWVDTASAANSWADRETVLAAAPRYIEPICAAGFLLADEDRGVILALLYNDHNDDVGQAIIIPRDNVRRIVQLRAGRGFKREPSPASPEEAA